MVQDWSSKWANWAQLVKLFRLSSKGTQNTTIWKLKMTQHTLRQESLPCQLVKPCQSDYSMNEVIYSTYAPPTYQYPNTSNTIKQAINYFILLFIVVCDCQSSYVYCSILLTPSFMTIWLVHTIACTLQQRSKVSPNEITSKACEVDASLSCRARSETNCLPFPDQQRAAPTVS